MHKWNPASVNSTGGGSVSGTIIGPLSSVGDTSEHPAPHQGNTKDLKVPTGGTMPARGYVLPKK